jgi:3'-phosphoadenosine 5'-phosphosulfate sulfotransferase (PAPS reductase)/FAD synthetase
MYDKTKRKTWSLIQDINKFKVLSLEEKEKLSLDFIEDWYNEFNGNVAVSFSGGLDSRVLLYLVRKNFPNVKAVYSNTGLEFPEITEFVKTFNNVDIVMPKKSFKYVISHYGYPVISKQVSRYVSDLQNPNENNINTRNLRLTGISSVTQEGKKMCNMKLSEKWQYLIKAPFKISDKCCNVLKKEPLNTYHKKTGLKRFIGLRADESNMREYNINIYGINQYDNKNPVSNPLAFWNHQDILNYILKYNLNYCKVYGEIKKDEEGLLYTTKEQRTGCIFCMFGIQFDQCRFKRLHQTHPNLYNYCMNKLEMRKVLHYLVNRE